MTPSSRRPRIALEVEPGELALRLGGGELRPLLARVEPHQHLAGLGHVAGLEGDRSTMPGRSALTVTPCTAATVRWGRNRRRRARVT